MICWVFQRRCHVIIRLRIIHITCKYAWQISNGKLELLWFHARISIVLKTLNIARVRTGVYRRRPIFIINAQFTITYGIKLHANHKKIRKHESGLYDNKSTFTKLDNSYRQAFPAKIPWVYLPKISTIIHIYKYMTVINLTRRKFFLIGEPMRSKNWILTITRLYFTFMITRKLKSLWSQGLWRFSKLFTKLNTDWWLQANLGRFSF